MSKNSSYYELEVMENQQPGHARAASQHRTSQVTQQSNHQPGYSRAASPPRTSQVTHGYNLRNRVTQGANSFTTGQPTQNAGQRSSTRASAASKAASIRKLQIEQQRDDDMLKLKRNQESLRMKLDSARIKLNSMSKKLKILRGKAASGEITPEEKVDLDLYETQVLDLEEKVDECQVEYNFCVNTAEAEVVSIQTRYALEKEQIESDDEDSDSSHAPNSYVATWVNEHTPSGDNTIANQNDKRSPVTNNEELRRESEVNEMSHSNTSTAVPPPGRQVHFDDDGTTLNANTRSFVPTYPGSDLHHRQQTNYRQYEGASNQNYQRPPQWASPAHRHHAMTQQQHGVGVEQLVEALGQAFGGQSISSERSRHSIDKELPFFGGKPEEWISFKSHYERTTLSNKYDNSENLYRLRKALKGEAWEAVQYLFNNPNNVKQIMETLELEFGRPETIIENLIRQVEITKNPDFSRPETVVEFARAVQTLYVSVASHRQFDYLNNVYLLNKFVDKLPTGMKREWIMYLQVDIQRKKNMTTFHDWISHQKRLAVEMVKPKTKDFAEEKKNFERRQKRGPGAIHVAVSEDGKDEKKSECLFCNAKEHRFITECKLFKAKDVDSRWRFVKQKRICFSCLHGFHSSKVCKSGKGCGVSGCKRRHHSLLHSDEKPNAEEGQGQERAIPIAPSDAESALAAISREVSSKPLSVVPVVLQAKGKEVHTFALLDSGANITVVEKRLAETLGLEGENFTHRFAGVGGRRQAEEAQKVSFMIKGKYNGADWHTVKEAVTMTTIGLPPYSLDVNAVKKTWPHLKRAKLTRMDMVVPQVIIGEDYPYLTAHREILEKGPHDPIAKRTKLGWVLGGDRVSGMNEYSSVNTLTGANTCRLDQLIKEGFSLEAFGVVPAKKKGSVQDERALGILEETSTLHGDRWECGLLWKDNITFMPQSKGQALQRLSSCIRKMEKDPTYAQLYHQKILEYERKGFIRKLSEFEASTKKERTWYIPHFGVFNPNKPGKIRLVFDAAAKSDGMSLNDYLLTGPDLIRPLVSVLWNIRIHNVAIMGDIEDMFHRVVMRKEDRNSQRFLWRTREGDTVTYEMEVMIFGAKSSPASAIFVKNKNAQQHMETFPEAARVIQDDFYVDDCLSGAKTDEAAAELREQIYKINLRGGFHVKKWTSSSSTVLQTIPEDLRAEGAKHFGEDKSPLCSERVLGLWWNPSTDTFGFKANFHKVDERILQGELPTKRQMCSLVMSVFDPLGFLGNFKIKGMIILQMTWKAGVGWDDVIPPSVYDEWKEWVSNLKLIEDVTIPRMYHRDLDDCDVQLHTFVDASEEAFASVSYFRITLVDRVEVAFVASKVRVSPLKKLTIPRLELLAAVLGTRLATKIGEELRVKVSARIFWSDSQTVLQWIRSESLRFKEFVGNRIGEIQELTSPSEWRWVPTAVNPADEATRLKTKIELTGTSLWLTGPEFLSEDPTHWPAERKSAEKVPPEHSGLVCVTLSDELGIDPSTDEGCRLSSGEKLICWERFSSFNRLVRVSASVCAAAAVFSDFNRIGPKRPPIWKNKGAGKGWVSLLLPYDLVAGETFLWKLVQREAFGKEIGLVAGGKLNKRNRLYKLQPFLDSYGLLGVKGRFGSDGKIGRMECHPLILPSRHTVVSLLIMKEHEQNGHQGQSTTLNALRKHYWILDARAAVRRETEKCPLCRIRLAKPVIPEMGNIPHFRLAGGQPPFTFTGVDYFGHVEVTVGRHHEKRWVALFTCMVTRAIHLEVAYGLSTDEMLMALSRFIDSRGRPHHIYSDNGTNFVGANKELKIEWEKIDWEELRGTAKLQEIEWHFQPPGAPHMSGVWERLVQSVKKVLKSTLHEKYPKDQTLLTILKGAENIVNSRPLTYVSNDVNDPSSLTPNDFLRGFCDMGPSLPGDYRDGNMFREQWKRAQITLDQFWKRWTVEYLPTLLLREKWHDWKEPIRVGDLVLLVDDTMPRNCWRRGIITKTIMAKDGQVRQVLVKVNGKDLPIRRPVSRICPLGLRMEMLSEEESFGDRNCRSVERKE